MQKVINALAVLSFLGTASIVGGGVYVYTQKDALIEGAKSRITETVTKAAVEAVTSALPGMLDNAVPELPSTTGGVVPEGIPGF